MDDKRHSTFTEYEDQADGSIKVVTESYFENLSSRRTDIVKKVKTSHKEFLTDIINCLDVINHKQTKELNLKITLDEYNNPDVIVKQYTLKKENFRNRR